MAETPRGPSRDAGVDLVLDAPATLGSAQLDRGRVVLALTNLTTNALRHAPRGTVVTLRARINDGVVHLEVEDQGPGVALEDRARIFEPFVRGAEESEGGGAGLGLSIAREVARAHGGQIGVTDAPGGGALFWLELPP